MNIIFFDGAVRNQLLPFTFTRPVAKIRVGIHTISEKWESRLSGSISFETADYLSSKFGLIETDDNLWINGALCPNENLLLQIKSLNLGEKLMSGNTLLAARVLRGGNRAEAQAIAFNGEFRIIDRPWKIFSENAAELELDFDQITAGRTSQPLSETNTLLGSRVFVEEGVEAECSVFNSKTGAIYLGKDSTVLEGCIIRGGLALGENSTLKMGAKIYGATTIGPHCKVGGEVNNCVILGFSNKGHDGFLGNSVIGEWCNLGADTNTSNLKNNYDEVRLWSFEKGGFEKTGLQFCGLMMGDHSKCGINTMFNTGTVVGVSANVFGSGFPRNFIPSFSWGGAAGLTEYKFDKAMDTTKRVMERRSIDLDDQERAILKNIFDNRA